MTLIHLIWKGKGWQVILVTFVCSLIAELITRAATGDENVYQSNPYPLSSALIISGVVIYILVEKMNRKHNVLKIIKINPPINAPQESHSFFFIPMKYWPWLLFLLSIINIVYNNSN